MKAKDVELVESSFAAVYGRKAELTERFYIHLFTFMPEAEQMFGNDFSKQKEMFATMLTYCIKGLVDQRSLHLAGESLAKTHLRLQLGAREADIAGRAVMTALEDVMGAALSCEQKAAWQRAINRVMHLVVSGNDTIDCAG